MKRLFLSLLTLFWSVLFITACGSESEKDSHLRDYFVIETTEIPLATPELDSNWRLLGLQFLNGEAIQIWGQNIRNEQLQGHWDVYVYHEDGSSEFKFGGVSNYYRDGWYMDEEGCFYVAMGNEFMKLDSEGKEVFSRTTDRTIKSMYQDKKGDWMVLAETEGGAFIVSRLDRETGELTDTDSIVVGSSEVLYYMSGQADGIYMLDKQGVWRLNPENDTKESIISFAETAYTLETVPENFRVTSEGTVELLLSGKKMTLTRINMADTRKVLTMCSMVDISNVREALSQFNQENDTYYVVWDAPKDDDDAILFQEKVGIEIATGGGPDLLLVGGTIAPDNIWDYVEKGVFVELNSYMEQSCIDGSAVRIAL